MQLDGDRLQFFRFATGIDDVDELKEHIIAVQLAAYEVSEFASWQVCSIIRPHVVDRCDLTGTPLPVYRALQLH